MKLDFLLVLNLVASTFCIAQGHFPLEVGNRWDYGELDFIPGGPAGHFVYERTVSVRGDTLLPNDKTYAVLSDGSLLREQGDTVFEYSQIFGEYVLYDFSRQNGDTLSTILGGDTLTTSVHKGSDAVFGVVRTIWAFNTYSTSSTFYSFIDIADGFGRTYGQWEPGYNEYCLGAIINGIQYGTINAVKQPGNTLPTRFSLSQNFPNPFNPSTTIQFSVPSRSFVTLEIFNVFGQTVARLLSEELPAGNYSRRWDAQGFASGAYFVRLHAGRLVESKKAILLK